MGVVAQLCFILVRKVCSCRAGLRRQCADMGVQFGLSKGCFAGVQCLVRPNPPLLHFGKLSDTWGIGTCCGSPSGPNAEPWGEAAWEPTGSACAAVEEMGSSGGEFSWHHSELHPITDQPCIHPSAPCQEPGPTSTPPLHQNQREHPGFCLLLAR